MFDDYQCYKHIIANYANGYYIYSFVLTFKPGSVYSVVHPKKAHVQVKEKFTKYLDKRGFKYIVFGELSQQGAYHCHGLLFDKSFDYETHDKRLRLLKNWFNRTFGWNGMQRIYDLIAPYATSDIRFLKKR